MIILTTLFIVGWVAVAALGTMAYFMGEQSKPIHERNWRSSSFERLAQVITNRPIDYSTRTPAALGGLDAYSSGMLPDA